eukprot:1533648-Prymnesium_polylepis.2
MSAERVRLAIMPLQYPSQSSAHTHTPGTSGDSHRVTSGSAPVSHRYNISSVDRAMGGRPSSAASRERPSEASRASRDPTGLR